MRLFGIVPPDHQAVVRQREADGVGRNPFHHPAHRPREREARPAVGHVHDPALEQLRHQPLRRGVGHVGEAHRRHVVGVGDDAVRQQRMERRLDARRRAVAEHAAGHEPHHLGVAHRLRLRQRREPGERQAGEAVAPDGAEVGAASLHQQRVIELDRRVAAAGLDQAGLPAEQVGQADEAVEGVGGGGGHAEEDAGAVAPARAASAAPRREARGPGRGEATASSGAAGGRYSRAYRIEMPGSHTRTRSTKRWRCETQKRADGATESLVATTSHIGAR